MMDNAGILGKLNVYAKIAELHNENPFKIRGYASAAFNLKKIKEPYHLMSDADLLAVPGVGKSVVESIREISTRGSMAALDALMAVTPPGIVEILQIKGLGPKKVAVIWNTLQIETVGDLLDACRQNRLVEVKGFGIKTQAEIVRSIEFSLMAQGKWHYARLWQPATVFLEAFKKEFPEAQIAFTGAFRRGATVLEQIEIICDVDPDEVLTFCDSQNIPSEYNDGEITATLNAQYPVLLLCTDADSYEREWFETTGSASHLTQLNYARSDSFSNETQYYGVKGFPWIPPEQREGEEELNTNFPREGFVEFWQLKGVLHNHTNYSDGLNTLREMAEYAKSQKFEYLGICDHSQSAAYAGGLKPERLLQQMDEIDALNEELTPFKIFKGVESDILSDGSLDYENEILSKLDFVVASIHSGLNMDQEKAHLRLVKAIENPYTTILGHPTGRLLLLRNGYPIDHAYIIDACAANGVCIELNAHPYRLDIDWTWLPYAQRKGVLISINPDAHEKQGYHDMYFGALAAKKGGLLTTNTLNAMPLEVFEQFLQDRRNQ
jgi:DNA polymerase (family 10)